MRPFLLLVAVLAGGPVWAQAVSTPLLVAGGVELRLGVPAGPLLQTLGRPLYRGVYDSTTLCVYREVEFTFDNESGLVVSESLVHWDDFYVSEFGVLVRTSTRAPASASEAFLAPGSVSLGESIDQVFERLGRARTMGSTAVYRWSGVIVSITFDDRSRLVTSIEISK